MGNDAAIAVLSDRPRLLYDYFTQLFAQVTNPPLDAIREELVTSLPPRLGPEGNLLEPTAASCRQIILPIPSSTTTSWPSCSTSTSTARRRATTPSPSTACSTHRRRRRRCAAAIEDVGAG